MVAVPTFSRNRYRQITFEDLGDLRAEGYIRESDPDQRDGFGPEIQRRNINGFAERYRLVLGDRWYTEFVTGRSVDKRRQFRQFLEDARMDLFDVLLVDHTSRFGRNQADCIRYKEEMERLGKVVVFVSQGIISGSDRDFISERINETLDEAYSRNLSRYVKEGKARKAEAGYALGRAPLGYKQEKAPSGRGAYMVPDESTMPALLALLEGYASGEHSFETLAQELNARDLRTSYANTFTQSSVNQVLSNPFYEGKFFYHRRRYDEELRDGVHIVPDRVKELWQRCQQVRRQKAIPGNPSPSTRNHRVYPLTGVLVCDQCDRPFHGVSTVSKPRSYPRMFHSLRRCHMRPLSVSAPSVEAEFVKRVLSCIRLDDGWSGAILQVLANEGAQPDNALQRKRIERALANLKKQHLWGAVTDEAFKAEYLALSRQLRALEPNAIKTVTPDLDRAAQLLTDLPALWQHPGVSAEQRRDLAREVFQEVRLREGHLSAVKPRPEYAPLLAYSIWRHNIVGGDHSS